MEVSLVPANSMACGGKYRHRRKSHIGLFSGLAGLPFFAVRDL
jgi:hypothetical protein